MNKFLSEIHKANNAMSKTIVIDLDGVIADFENCTVGCDYSGYPETATSLRRDLCPVCEGMSGFLEELKSEGYKIIIHTSRVTDEMYATICWLQEHNIRYDEIYFNKPRGFIYVDDLAHEFKSIADVRSEIKRRQSQ